MRGQDKLKVLIVIDNLNLGGAERQAFLLADRLNRLDDFDAKVTALISEGNLTQTTFNLSSFVKVRSLRQHSKLLGIIIETILFSFRLRKLKPDVLISFTIRPNRIMNFAWQLTGAKASFWNQRDDGFGFSNRKDFLFTWAFYNATAFIANSSVAQNALLKLHSKIGNKIHIIPNVLEELSPVHDKTYWKEQLGVSHQLVAVMIANLTNRKDHETVIRSWNHLKSLGTTQLPKLVFVGRKAETYDHLKKLIEEYNLSDHIVMVDFVEDIAGILSIADFGIHSSASESMPNAILDFMRSSKIVIASKIAAHEEVLGVDYPFLFEVGNHQDLGDLIIKLMKEKSSFDWVGIENFRKFQQHYTVIGMTEKYVKLLKEIH